MKSLYKNLAALLAVTLATGTLILAEKANDVGDSEASTHLVFAHFMVGIVSNRESAADYDYDMQRAKAYGIDAFALNIGMLPSTDEQLRHAYESAANNEMKVFLSFDFNWYSSDSAIPIGRKIAQYASNPAQLLVDGKVFVSSFGGDGLKVQETRDAAGVPLYFAPNFQPETDMSDVDGALNWMAWPNDGNNKAPQSTNNVTVASGDQKYEAALGAKGYVAPVSPWFFTHYGDEVSYSKNWIFPSGLLWFQRWQEVLTLGPRFIEIISWNDYGESHYVGPLDSKHIDDGASKWVNDMPHDGWLDMAKPFITAYKAGLASVDDYITSDQLIYWYKPQLKTADCSATDTCMATANNATGNYFVGRPNGYETVSDSIFIALLLTSAGVLQVTSRDKTYLFNAPAGASSYSVPMQAGQVRFSLTRGGDEVAGMSGTSLKEVIDGCICGLWNYNAYVGTVPPSFRSQLSGEGFAQFANGLRDVTCSATPSLPADLIIPSSAQTLDQLTTRSTVALVEW